MNEQKLSKLQGSIIAAGPGKAFGARRTRYDAIRLRISDTREATIRDVIAATEMGAHLAAGTAVTLFFIQSPSTEKFLFAIDAGGQRIDVIDQIGQDQAWARKMAVKWLIGSFLLCFIVIGLVLLPITIRGMILLRRAPKPAEMRAFLAANPPVPEAGG